MEAAEKNIIIEQPPKDYSSFDNYSKKKVTLIGYLIGVKDSFLSKDPFDQEHLKTIDAEEDLKIIRALSTIRLNFLFSYDKIFQEKKSLGPFAQFDKMDKYIDISSLKYLSDKKIVALQAGIDASMVGMFDNLSPWIDRIVTACSIGGIIATVLDIADGQWNGDICFG